MHQNNLRFVSSVLFYYTLTMDVNQVKGGPRSDYASVHPLSSNIDVGYTSCCNVIVVPYIQELNEFRLN